MLKRPERSWVLENLSMVESESEPGKRWTIYIGHWLHDTEVGEVVQKAGRLEFRDKAGQLRASYANMEEFEQHNELGTFFATAPAWLIFGWKSRIHRLRAWRKSRGKKSSLRRSLRREFDAAFKGPRWNEYPIDYAKLPDTHIRSGNRSAVKRMRKKLNLPRKIPPC